MIIIYLNIIYICTYVQIFTNLFKLEMKIIENIKNKQARKTVEFIQTPYNIIEYYNIIAQLVGPIIKLYICTYPCTYSSITKHRCLVVVYLLSMVCQTCMVHGLPSCIS